VTDQLAYLVARGIASIRLNRPQALNALNNTMVAVFVESVQACARDESARVLVIEGAGRAFCAGDDLVDMSTPQHPNPPDKLQEYLQGYPAIVQALRDLQKPVICKVRGYALGAGCEIVLASDLVVADEGAKFGLPFARRGMVAGTALLPRLVGYQKACEILFLGDMFTADEARNMGILYRVVPADQLDETTAELAGRLAESATGAIGLIKASVNASLNADLAAAMKCQAEATVASSTTTDFREGKQAFAEKRTACFTGH